MTRASLFAFAVMLAAARISSADGAPSARGEEAGVWALRGVSSPGDAATTRVNQQTRTPLSLTRHRGRCSPAVQRSRATQSDGGIQPTTTAVGSGNAPRSPKRSQRNFAEERRGAEDRGNPPPLTFLRNQPHAAG